jgi:hypothetical protein
VATHAPDRYLRILTLEVAAWFLSMRPCCAGRMRTRLSLPRITSLARAMRPVLLACLDDLG